MSRTHPTALLLTATVLAATAIIPATWHAATATHPFTPRAGAEPQATTGPRRPGLPLRPGAMLAPPKILDLTTRSAGLTRVIEDQDGAERREQTATGMTFALQAKVLFTKDSARLSLSARSRIAAVAEQIRAQPATTIRILGYTDNLGFAAHADHLSRQRARAVRDVLAAQLRDRTVTFDVRGLGERHPVASNATEAGRQKNRRVEITLTHRQEPNQQTQTLPVPKRLHTR
ncbi:OmpA family protein [Streptomyces sp. NPDC052013]|uniref:OmpA family protein n=1 Tax=Streptomyces sp. NPDC052013 TaxID=3365679 RepID=UPI0037D57D19